MATFSCAGTASMKEVHLIDSLNQVAYNCRYRNLDASYKAASSAYSQASLYSQGKAEACNSLAFCAFMHMDFEQAVKLHQEVSNLTKNEVELLVADVGLMKVYQRTALNKEFYDCRNSALHRMKRLEEDRQFLTNHREKMRLEYARSEFNIVSAIYYNYLQQQPEAAACIAAADLNGRLVADTNQYLYYHYIKGVFTLNEKGLREEQQLRKFDELYSVWYWASRKGYLYFEGCSMQGLANLMVTTSDYMFYERHRALSIQQFAMPLDSLLPMRMGQQALQKFRQYNDLYQITGAYVSIGRYLNLHGRYEEALDTLQVALECVNSHHHNYYNCRDSLDWLKMHDKIDEPCAETEWMKLKQKIAPEWISSIREQLSVSYAGLGMKSYSDYNRNIYLDILENTRQDKELESRYQALQTEAKQLNMLLGSLMVGFILVLLVLSLFNRRSKERSRLHVQRLQLMLKICQKIIASIPADAQTEREVVDAIRLAVLPDLEILFRNKSIRIENRSLVFGQHICKDEQAMVKVITPYIHWALDNGIASISLGDECRRLEKQYYVYEQHIAGHKRQNVVKKACLSILNGIHPYIDRIINEVHKLIDKGYLKDKTIKEEKFLYIDELVTAINEYNDILTLWVKMKQGSISLNIENFKLNELFELLRKGSRSFEMKHLLLEVLPTNTCVKADKALTFFMINTLAENARKYTPAGGKVKVCATPAEDYVEISIEDTGRGLSPEDVAHIIGEKVYDPKAIGMAYAVDREELKRNKGHGFGLMNCKGIIEKYKKTNDLFKVCLFNVESTLGKGSRFYFRLPLGGKKIVVVLAFFLSLCCVSCQYGEMQDVSLEDMAVDSPTLAMHGVYECLLDTASAYADDAYFHNIDREYEQALQSIDSAIYYLNKHYEEYAVSPNRFMTLTGEEEPTELEWWNGMFNTDFHIILDIRNEAAVSFLALKQWKAYDYNNAAYTTLYKLLGKDQSLEEYCTRLKRSASNKIVGMSIAFLLLLVLLLGYYILYVRKRWVNRWNLEQILEIDKQVFTASRLPLQKADGVLQLEEDVLQEIPQRIMESAFDTINELLGIDRLCMAVYNDTSCQLEYSACPLPDSIDNEEDSWKELLKRVFEEAVPLNEGKEQAYPLVVEVGGISRCIGSLYVEKRTKIRLESDNLLLELIVRYISIIIFNAVVKLATKYHDIEAAQDENRRASWEDSQLHVQNLVLDNCLSTIKHETAYYPTRIKQLIERLRFGHLSSNEEQETIMAVNELIEYYKGIFTILSQCASRQLEEVTFRRTIIAVADLQEAARKYFHRMMKGHQERITLEMDGRVDAKVIGDINLLSFLLENLIDEALSVSLDGTLLLSVAVDEHFVMFSFTDLRREKSHEELNQLFYPSLKRMTSRQPGNLYGTEYLVCKQIIRDHDEFAGRRGCRINAKSDSRGGFTVYFTIPIKKEGLIKERS